MATASEVPVRMIAMAMDDSGECYYWTVSTSPEVARLAALGGPLPFVEVKTVTDGDEVE